SARRSMPASKRRAASAIVSKPFRVSLFMVPTMEQVMSEKSEKRSEFSEMHSVEFVQYALRERVAPPSIGSVKARLRYASRALGWSDSRTKDAWYADPRIS